MEGIKITKGVQVPVSIVENAGEKRGVLLFEELQEDQQAAQRCRVPSADGPILGVWLDVDWRFFVMLLFYGPNLWKEALGASPTNDILG